MLLKALHTKSGLMAAFFLLLLPWFASGASASEAARNYVTSQLKEAAILEQLHQSPVWSALLHSENGRYNIADTNFLLSLPKFSLSRELQETLDFLYQGEQGNVCRFPARYLWLRRQLSAPELPLEDCPDVVEFSQKAPLDTITLVFASENIARPASMLGHAFLKFSGKNGHGQNVSHAISFYTDANTINLPKLLFDSMVIGKKGYFSLTPYYEKQQLYVDEEQRNMWEYQLSLGKFQKELIRLHLLELKQSHLTYFFQNYNCATLLNFILQLSGKSMPRSGWWVTPKDVIKNAHQSGIIGDTSVITPSRWMVRALAEQVPVAEQETIRKKVRYGNVSNSLNRSGSEPAFIRLELARAYNQFTYLGGDMSKDVWIENDRDLNEIIMEFFPDKSLSTDYRYNPINAPGDSQISLAAIYDKGEHSLALTVLPLSHTVLDDNRNYTNETSLQLFATTVKFPLRDGRPKLERLTIYEMQTLMPRDKLTGGISGRFNISAEPQLNSRLEVSRAIGASGALGVTERITQDVDIYLLGGGGFGYTSGRSFLYSAVESGTILREVWGMKSLLSLTRTDNQVDRGSYYYTLVLDQSKFIGNENTINFEWKWDFNNEYKRNRIAISFKKIF